MTADAPGMFMIAMGSWEVFYWWGEISVWFIDVGTMMILGGLVIMMWPALYNRFGKLTLPVILAGIAAIYAIGATAMALIQSNWI